MAEPRFHFQFSYRTRCGSRSWGIPVVSLITLHSAKGLEFDVVVMMGMKQGRLPSWAAKTPDQKREPRRLFYVGLTRARDEVHMTCSGFWTDRSGRRHQDGASEFLVEVYRKLNPPKNGSAT